VRTGAKDNKGRRQPISDVLLMAKGLTDEERALFEDLARNFDRHVEGYREKKEKEFREWEVRVLRGHLGLPETDGPPAREYIEPLERIKSRREGRREPSP